MTGPAELDELHHAIKRGDLPALRMYLERGGSVAATDRYGWTLLLMAAKQGHTPMVQALLEAGADPNGGFGNGFTPLVAAGFSGSGESVAALLAAGADPSVVYGHPLLEIMRQQGRSRIVKLLEAAIVAGVPARSVKPPNRQKSDDHPFRGTRS